MAKPIAKSYLTALTGKTPKNPTIDQEKKAVIAQLTKSQPIKAETIKAETIKAEPIEEPKLISQQDALKEWYLETSLEEDDYEDIEYLIGYAKISSINLYRFVVANKLPIRAWLVEEYAGYMYVSDLKIFYRNKMIKDVTLAKIGSTIKPAYLQRFMNVVRSGDSEMDPTMHRTPVDCIMRPRNSM